MQSSFGPTFWGMFHHLLLWTILWVQFLFFSNYRTYLQPMFGIKWFSMGLVRKTTQQKFDVVIVPDFPRIESYTYPGTWRDSMAKQIFWIFYILWVGQWDKKGNHTSSKSTISRNIIIPTLLWYRYILHSAPPA
jgi:hypothetical protein